MIIPRGNNGVINSKGQANIMTSSSGGGGEEKASATGAAFFDANATGKLAFLGNIVAVYKDIIYNNKDGTDKIVAWEWK